MPPDFEIRPARPEDAAVLLELIRGLAEYEKLLHEVRATEDALRETLFGARPWAEAVVGRRGGEPIGFALFFHNYSTFLAKPGLYLEDLYVKPEHRGQGFGRALFLYVARVAKERGCGRFEWSALDWNEPAIRFYRNHGAEPLSEWTVYRVTGEALDRLAEETANAR